MGTPALLLSALLAVSSGSYGGCMTLAAATFAPKEFAAHVDIFGVSDLKRKVPVDYRVIEGEGHGFSKNETRQLAYETTHRVLDRYILGDTEVVVLGK